VEIEISSLDVAGNPIIARTLEEIRTNGRISFGRFMELSVSQYYTGGAARITTENEGGDFTTLPEKSRIYCFFLAKACKMVWEACGKPESFAVVEMGAGEGGLALFFLRWAREEYPEFFAALRYVIVEPGESLTCRQRRRILPEFSSPTIRWVRGSALALPLGNVTGVLLSNELIDAFPVERVRKIEGKTRQLYLRIRRGRLVEAWERPSRTVYDFLRRYSCCHCLTDTRETPVGLLVPAFRSQVDAALLKGGVITVDYAEWHPRISHEKDPIRVYRYTEADTTRQDMEHAYRYPGICDMTADANMDVLVSSVPKDGLRTAFAGDLCQLAQVVGLEDILGMVRRKMVPPTAWPEVLRLASGWQAFGKHLNKLQPDVACVQLKGVPAHTNPFSDSAQEPKCWESAKYVPWVPLKGFKPHQELFLMVRGETKAEDLSCRTAFADEGGVLMVSPLEVGRMAITGRYGSLMVDFLHDSEGSRRFLRKSGYALDVETPKPV
jgi:SAM-dependent MidA family methyltransferase